MKSVSTYHPFIKGTLQGKHQESSKLNADLDQTDDERREGLSN